MVDCSSASRENSLRPSMGRKSPEVRCCHWQVEGGGIAIEHDGSGGGPGQLHDLWLGEVPGQFFLELGGNCAGSLGNCVRPGDKAQISRGGEGGIGRSFAAQRPAFGGGEPTVQGDDRVGLRAVLALKFG